MWETLLTCYLGIGMFLWCIPVIFNPEATEDWSVREYLGTMFLCLLLWPLLLGEGKNDQG